MWTTVESRRVLIGAASLSLRETVRQVLACHQGLCLVGESSTGGDVIADAVRLQPDVAILDVRMPDIGGIEVARRLRQLLPRTRVVLLLNEDAQGYRAAASRTGAAYVSKDRLVEELPSAIRRGNTATAGDVSSDLRGGIEMHTYIDGNTVDAGIQTSNRDGRSRARLFDALRPALAVFFVGILLLTLAIWLGGALGPSLVERSAIVASDGTTYITDEAGLLGRPGAVVGLNPAQRDRYFQALTESRQNSLTLCIAIAVLGLLVGSLLVGWLEAKELSRPFRSPSRFSPFGVAPLHQQGPDA